MHGRALTSPDWVRIASPPRQTPASQHPRTLGVPQPARSQHCCNYWGDFKGVLRTMEEMALISTPNFWGDLKGVLRTLEEMALISTPNYWGDFKGVLRAMFSLICACLYKHLSKQSRGWWFETPSRPLWRHCNEWNLQPDELMTATQPPQGYAMYSIIMLDLSDNTVKFMRTLWFFIRPPVLWYGAGRPAVRPVGRLLARKNIEGTVRFFFFFQIRCADVLSWCPID